MIENILNNISDEKYKKDINNIIRLIFRNISDKVDNIFVFNRWQLFDNEKITKQIVLHKAYHYLEKTNFSCYEMVRFLIQYEHDTDFYYTILNDKAYHKNDKIDMNRNNPFDFVFIHSYYPLFSYHHHKHFSVKTIGFTPGTSIHIDPTEIHLYIDSVIHIKKSDTVNRLIITRIEKNINDKIINVERTSPVYYYSNIKISYILHFDTTITGEDLLYPWYLMSIHKHNVNL